MIVTTLPLGPLQTNCYILQADLPRCLVIDPADSAGQILTLAAQRGLTIKAVLLTHGHFDHVGAVKALMSQTGCRVYICREDLALPSRITGGPLTYTDTYGEGDTLTLAGMTFTVLQGPGHTPGSVCLRFEQDLFTGDILFAGSCGRTDLPGGDPRAMTATLRRLAQLPGDYRVWPGHGESTTLEEEKRYNLYLRSAKG